MKKNKVHKERKYLELHTLICVFSLSEREALSEETIFKLRSEEWEGASHGKGWWKSVLWGKNISMKV